MKCGNLNFLELSGPLQACNGAALAFPIMPEQSFPSRFPQNIFKGSTRYLVINKQKFWNEKFQIFLQMLQEFMSGIIKTGIIPLLYQFSSSFFR